jgi:hypothetical protein
LTVPVALSTESTVEWMHSEPAHGPPVMLLTACAWCERVKLDGAWVDAGEAISSLRTYTLPDPPSFTHGICPDCLVGVEQMSARARSERAERAK